MIASSRPGCETEDLGSPPAGMGQYRWVICALLFLATSINYIDRQILALIKPILDDKLGWNNEQYGAVNAAFQAAYAVGLLGFGWFIDRFGVKIGYAVSIAAWSLAAMGHGLVGSVNGFLAARVALGLGEGGNFPSAIKTVALWFPKKERAFATSIFNSGANVGAIIAPLTVRKIAEYWGWQAAFVMAGIAGIGWLALWLPFYEAPERQKRLSPRELAYIRGDLDEAHAHEKAHKAAWGELLASSRAWSFIVAKFMTDAIWWFFLTWLPDYFKQTRHLDLKSSWIHLVTIYSLVTVLSIIGGWVPGYLIRKGWSITAARKTCMLVSAVCVMPIFFATQVNDWEAVLLIGLAGAAHQAWSANLFSTVSDMFPKRMVASLTGLGSMAGSAGAIMFPIYTGWLLDQFKAAGNVTGGYSILFGICAIAYVLAFAVNHVLAPSFARLTIKAEAAH